MNFITFCICANINIYMVNRYFNKFSISMSCYQDAPKNVSRGFHFGRYRSNDSRLISVQVQCLALAPPFLTIFIWRLHPRWFHNCRVTPYPMWFLLKWTLLWCNYSFFNRFLSCSESGCCSCEDLMLLLAVDLTWLVPAGCRWALLHLHHLCSKKGHITRVRRFKCTDLNFFWSTPSHFKTYVTKIG